MHVARHSPRRGIWLCANPVPALAPEKPLSDWLTNTLHPSPQAVGVPRRGFTTLGSEKHVGHHFGRLGPDTFRSQPADRGGEANRRLVRSTTGKTSKNTGL